jgi:predicted TIM-barrel fold metal-dependent hydrolase
MIFAQAVNQPIIDMHMHVYADGFNIPNPNTGLILAKNAEEHLFQSLKFMKENNVVMCAISGVVQSDHKRNSKILNNWEKATDDGVLKGLFLGMTEYPSVDTLRNWFNLGKYDFLGELGLQYEGLSPSDTLLFKYYELAQELDIPVGIHTGTSAPSTPYNCCPEFRLSLGNPYLLEEILVKFPRLRIWAMHAGGQYFNEMVTMMTMYSQLYVDISPYTWLENGNAEILDRFLLRAKEQNVLERVMFGSDQMWWPEAIEAAVKRLKSLKYLSNQNKADILYNNAARFLKLSEKEISKHYNK